MFLLLISAILVISPALSRPQEPAPSAQASPQQGGSTPIPIVSQSAETKEDGGFSYSFETGNGIKVEETGTIKQGPQGRSATGEADNNTIIVLAGSFSYTAPDGQNITLKYVADENGFQPEGAHLPTPPPGIQEAINALKQGAPAEPAQPQQQAQPAPPPQPQPQPQPQAEPEQQPEPTASEPTA